MKITAITSGRKSGNSKQILRHCVESCQADNLEIAELCLSEKKIEYCDGCLTCDEAGKCHKNDDMCKAISDIEDSDALVFISPTRWSLLSGDLKVFLDRLNPLAMPQKLSGKKAIIICVGQSSLREDQSIKHAITSIEYFCDNAGIKVIGSHAVEGCLIPGDVTERDNDLESCARLLSKLTRSEEG